MPSIDCATMIAFQIDSANGSIAVKKSLTTVTKFVSKYILTIEARDNASVASQQRRTMAFVSIVVRDQESNAPVPAQSNYSASVSEAAVVGSIVLDIDATDADPDSQLRYLLTNGSNASSVPFDVNVNR